MELETLEEVTLGQGLRTKPKEIYGVFGCRVWTMLFGCFLYICRRKKHVEIYVNVFEMLKSVFKSQTWTKLKKEVSSLLGLNEEEEVDRTFWQWQW